MKHVWRNYASSVDNATEDKSKPLFSDCDFVYYDKTIRTKTGKLLKAGTFDEVKAQGVEPQFKTVEQYVQSGGSLFNGRPREAFKVKTILRKKVQVDKPAQEEQRNKTYYDARENWG
jgi:hypothetical protein